MNTRQCERLAIETPGLPLKEILQQMNAWQTDSWERAARLNVTKQDMGNNRLFINYCLFFSSVPSKPRCKNTMQAWLHWIYQCYASLTLPCGLADKGNGRRGEQDWRLPVAVVGWRLLAFTLLQILCAVTSYVTSLLNLLFHLGIVCTTCITLSPTHACNHANRWVGWTTTPSTWVTLGLLIITVKAWMFI